MLWLNILLLRSDNDSVERDSNISDNLFHELIQILVMQFKSFILNFTKLTPTLRHFRLEISKKLLKLYPLSLIQSETASLVKKHRERGVICSN